MTTTDIINTEPEFERVARFQSLQAGQYWRAQRSIVEEGIDEGTVLLIQSIRWVDDAPHTIVLRPHPSKIGQRVYLEIPQEDGSTQRSYFVYDEHRFLLNDFLDAFTFEPDHQHIRSSEVRDVQNRINALQAELLETQSSPALLANIVEAGLREEADKAARRDEQDDDETADEATQRVGAAMPIVAAAPAGGSLVAFATSTVADAIGAGITSEGIAAIKAAANREHQVATIKSKWIQGKTTEIAETIKAMTPYYEEQAAAALAQTEDVRSYVAKLMKGIESLDLYIGKDVEVQTIREGSAAPKDEPLLFVQKKLLMDEELAVWTDIDEWFDFEKEHLFFDALRNHDGLIKQIFPTERCVLVMAVTRRYLDYGDKWANEMRNSENRKVFLLVRNGMNIHRVFSPVESHLGTARLFPTKDDQERIFRGLDGSKIKFEDVAYTDKLADHERFALHFKRFLLLICGLDHRMKLFGDFYDGPPSLNFVSMDFQERYCRFLHDDDDSWLLPGEGRPSVADWIREKNTYLRSGSRVLCNWYELMNPDTAPGACKENHDHRGRGFDLRYDPTARMAVVIAYREADAICVDVEVSGYSYSAGADRKFNCKVNLSKSDDSRWDHGDLPFLCLDAVQPEELHWYIHHRGSRSNHLAYIRFFKQALKRVERERADEKDSRQRLARALQDGDIADPSEREAIISQAVIAWRAANRGRPLPRFDGGHAPAWKALLDQMYMLAGEGKRRIAEVENFVRENGLAPLRLVLSGGAKLVVYAAPRPEECDDRLERHAWVHRITVERGKTKYSEKSRRWALLPEQAASETTLHQWDGASGWAERVSAFPSLERKASTLAEARSFASLLKPFSTTMGDWEHEVQLEDWRSVRHAALENSKYVPTPVMAVPFGVVYYPRTKEFRFLCVGIHDTPALLARLAPDDEARKRVREVYIKPCLDKINAQRRFDAGLGGDLNWCLLETTLNHAEHRRGVYVHSGIGVGVETLDGRVLHSPLLADWFDSWRSSSKDQARIWLADGALDSAGRLAVDTLLGIKLPQDYEPVRVRDISLSGGVLPQYHRWLDLCPGAEARGENSSPWASGRDTEIKQLVDSLGSKDHSGYSTSHRLFLSRQAARAAISEWVDAPLRAIPSADLADAPQPPDGYERWYIVQDEVA